jgi:hypothetical protein
MQMDRGAGLGLNQQVIGSRSGERINRRGFLALQDFSVKWIRAMLEHYHCWNRAKTA